MYHLLRNQIKKIALIVAIGAFASPAMAQDKEIYRQEHDNLRYYFGITLGYNATSLRPTFSTKFLLDDSIKVARPSASGGIALGFLGTLRLNNHFQLRINPQLVIGGAKSFEYTLNKDSLALGESQYMTKTLPATLISLPIHIKFNSDRIDNFRFYVLGGIRLERNLASPPPATNGDEKVLSLKQNDFGLETGVGFNFFLPFVTISPEIKFTYGLSNLNDRNPDLKYSAVFDKIQSRMISFSLHFED